MTKLHKRQEQIVHIIKETPRLSFQEIFRQLGQVGGERTIKRDLTELVKAGYLRTEGGGRSLVYEVPLASRLFIPIDAVAYASSEPDERRGVLELYQSSIWNELPDSLFAKEAIDRLEAETVSYHARHQAASADIRQRELERFVIELSWKSSRIEGNTYTLLDTERLLKEGVPSSTNTKEETIMILNHKTAFDFVYNSPPQQETLTRAYVEEVHRLLMNGLLNDIGLRKFGVGITGSRYKPLDNQFLIEEALDDSIRTINKVTSVYDKALLALLSISYIQPFVDGNKRTARLVANALLLSYKAIPLSYRSVDEVMYRASLLTFYEQLSLVPVRDIFIDQYHFAAQQY